jgi:hypothetical protein
MPNRQTTAPTLPPCGARDDLSDEDRARGRCQMLIVLMAAERLPEAERLLSLLVGDVKQGVEGLDLR